MLNDQLLVVRGAKGKDIQARVPPISMAALLFVMMIFLESLYTHNFTKTFVLILINKGISVCQNKLHVSQT